MTTPQQDLELISIAELRNKLMERLEARRQKELDRELEIQEELRNKEKLNSKPQNLP